jgi:hypothetical protein
VIFDGHPGPGDAGGSDGEHDDHVRVVDISRAANDVITPGANDNDTHCPPGSEKEPACTRTRTTTAKFPDESPVEVRYPRSKQEEQGDREQWPWLPGTIVEQCGPDEWYVCVEVRELAVLRDGRRAPRGTASRNLYYPCCFRDGSEIRPFTASSGAAPATRRGAAR